MNIVMKVCTHYNKKMALKIIHYVALIDVHGMLDDLQSVSPDSSFQSSDTSDPSSRSSDHIETVMVDRTATPSMVCSPSSNSDPSPRSKKDIAKEKELTRLKQWESEQTAELEKCVKFTQETCGCTLAHGNKPCSTLLPLGYYVDYRAQVFLLSREQLDMVLLGSIASNIHEDDDVGTRSGRRAAKRLRTSMEYKHKGYTICRKTFTFLHDISHHKVQAIKTHFSENGLAVRVHGNSQNSPHNALTYERILNLLRFIQNYTEQNAILLPGRIPGFKRDDIKVLPTSDTKKVHTIII